MIEKGCQFATAGPPARTDPRRSRIEDIVQGVGPVADGFFDSGPADIVAAADDFSLFLLAHGDSVMRRYKKRYALLGQGAAHHGALISPGESCKRSVLLTMERKWPIV